MSDLPGDDEYARNLIGGRWVFPAAPYEYEVRSPHDSTVTAVVPLSSRFDVARAVAAAREAAPAWASLPAAGRQHLLGRLVHRIAPLAHLQAVETGLSAEDADATALIAWCERLLGSPPPASDPGVAAFVLSWGLPLAETVCAVLPQLLAGRTVVIKPSLRAPLSAVGIAHLATGLDFPAGVVNLVQGTGLDVGAALLSTPGLAHLQVRGGPRTLDAALRAVTTTGSPLSVLRGGGNVAIAGPHADPEQVAAAVADALRVHSTGGPLGLPLLLVHARHRDSVTDAILDLMPRCDPAPLPTEPLRRQALHYAASMRDAGTEMLCGGRVPDDAKHRMSWRMPPTVLFGLPPVDVGEPLGPVLTIGTWDRPDELAAILNQPRHADGIACVWGMDSVELKLPQPTIVNESGPLAALSQGLLRHPSRS